MRVLMVCLGNICRSPLAHGILQREIEERELTGWLVDSAGTSGHHAGAPPDPRSEAEALRHGIDISTQRSRPLVVADFDRFDRIVVMDASNYQDAVRLAPKPEDAEKVELLMNYAEPGRNQQVPDPYWDDDGFAGVFEMVERGVLGLLGKAGA